MVSQTHHVKAIHWVEGDPEVVGVFLILTDPRGITERHAQHRTAWEHRTTLHAQAIHDVGYTWWVYSEPYTTNRP